jgi:hypothetical protein
MEKIFVLVDKNLSRSQQAVQSGHALIQFVSDWHGSADWDKMALVLLAVSNEEELEGWIPKLDAEYKSFFCEPYWQDRLTAVVVHGEHVEEQLKDLHLL